MTFFEPDVVRGDEIGLWARGVPIGCCERHFAGTPGTSRRRVHGWDGLMATSTWPRCSWAIAVNNM